MFSNQEPKSIHKFKSSMFPGFFYNLKEERVLFLESPLGEDDSLFVALPESYQDFFIEGPNGELYNKFSSSTFIPLESVASGEIGTIFYGAWRRIAWTELGPVMIEDRSEDHVTIKTLSHNVGTKTYRVTTKGLSIRPIIIPPPEDEIHLMRSNRAEAFPLYEFFEEEAAFQFWSQPILTWSPRLFSEKSLSF